jgi:hypothetical protein
MDVHTLRASPPDALQKDSSRIFFGAQRMWQNLEFLA